MGFARKASQFIFGGILNFPRWFGARQVANGGKYIAQGIRKLTEIPEEAEAETFAAAVARMDLSEVEIKAIKNGYLRNSILFSLLTFALISYAIYLVINAAWVASIITLMMSAAAGTMLVWSHFWYFQIKHRKLGCSFREWLANKPEQQEV